MKKEIDGYISDLPDGCITETDIYTSNGVLLCPKLTIINKKVMETLKSYKGRIHVTISYTEPEQPIDTIPEKDDSLDFSESLKTYALESITNIQNNLDNPRELAKNAMDISHEINNVISHSKVLGINLSKLKISDEYTYKHSVDVGTIAGLIAAHMGESERFVHDITISGILHDIGKEKIPKEILNKPSKLTDEEFKIIQLHPLYGYQILKPCRDLTEEIKQGVLNHHENIDGTGYPRKLNMQQMGKMEKILAIADVFDALTTQRPYKNAKTPAQSIEIMFTMSNKFDMKIFRAFLDIVNAYPNGSIVKLSNGMSGTVIRQNKSYPLRPVIQIENKKEPIDLSTNIEYLSTIICN